VERSSEGKLIWTRSSHSGEKLCYLHRHSQKMVSVSNSSLGKMEETQFARRLRDLFFASRVPRSGCRDRSPDALQNRVALMKTDKACGSRGVLTKRSITLAAFTTLMIIVMIFILPLMLISSLLCPFELVENGRRQASSTRQCGRDRAVPSPSTIFMKWPYSGCSCEV
jgi:hypothetical protein